VNKLVAKYKYKITRSFVVETDTDSKTRARELLGNAREAGLEEEYLVFESISDPAAIEDTDSGFSKALKTARDQILGYPNRSRN
jgi:hypothetical protein